MSSFVQLSLMIGPAVPVPVPKEVIDAVESIEVTSSTTGASGFSISFKLSTRSPLHTLFMLGAGAPIPLVRVIIMVKVAGETTLLMDGVMTEHDVSPGQAPGMATLTVKGEDLSAAMKYLWMSGLPFPAMGLYERVNVLLLKYAALGVVPLVIPPIFDDREIPTESIESQEKDDHFYITKLARLAGYVFYVDPGPKPGMSVAYFGPEIRWGVPQPALSSNFDGQSNVESLSFSYDADKAKMPILYHFEKNSKMTIPIPLPGVSLLKPPLGAVPPIPKKSDQIYAVTNESLGRALLMGLAESADAQDAVTGTGNLDVRRYGRVLKARGLVGVRGAGDAFNGLYFVRSVTSSIQRGSFTQSFQLIRNGLLSTVPAVPVN